MAIAEILKGTPNIRKLPLHKGTPTFPLGVVLWWVLANPSCMPNMKLLDLAVAQIFKGNPNIWGAPLAQGHVNFFICVRFYDRLWQTILKLPASAVAEILYGNPKYLGSSPSPRPCPLFPLGVIL